MVCTEAGGVSGAQGRMTRGDFRSACEDQTTSANGRYILVYRAKREGDIGVLFVREAFESWDCETGAIVVHRN